MAIRLAAVALGNVVMVVEFFNFHLEVSNFFKSKYFFIILTLFQVHKMKWEKLLALPLSHTGYLAGDEVALLFNVLLDQFVWCCGVNVFDDNPKRFVLLKLVAAKVNFFFSADFHCFPVSFLS